MDSFRIGGDNLLDNGSVIVLMPFVEVSVRQTSVIASFLLSLYHFKIGLDGFLARLEFDYLHSLVRIACDF